jgi:catechol 2,3-dioxygenase-like lactoylglutathione lyase family enzyme
MDFSIDSIDHVQLAAPARCEAEARRFYGDLLGMREIEKPAELKARGGCWFQCGSQQIHIGVEKDFRAARKAHPAFRVKSLDSLRERLIAHGVAIREDGGTIPGVQRFHCDDPFGNRLEFLD